MQRSKLEAQLLAGARRLVQKGFLNDRLDSVSARIAGSDEMLLMGGVEDWGGVGDAAFSTIPFSSQETVSGLHGAIYLARPDVGAIAISSPRGVRLLAGSGEIMPPLFDELVRHIGLPSWTPLDAERLSKERIRGAFSGGANATLLGERLVCLGMTVERVIHNTELLEKCARAYVIAKASGGTVRTIPSWVRLIANHRLMRDERNAEASYENGQAPEMSMTY
jgi:ribulose-5-phosphate 4-epimerase/fuculose-1-phosphate aldolase